MGAITTTSSPAGLAGQFRAYFEKALIERMEPLLVLGQSEFAIKSPLPKSAGAKSIRLWRFASTTKTTAEASVQTLTEPSTPTAPIMPYANHKQLDLEYVDTTLTQYGQVISITDQLETLSLFDMVKQANVQNAEDAAMFCDWQVNYELSKTSGTDGNVTYSNKKLIYANGAANYAAVYNTGTLSASLILTASDLLDSATSLKINKAPRIAGGYAAVVPPQVARDLMKGANSNTTWVNVNQYNNATKIFNGEIGKLYGVRVMETSEAYRSAATVPGSAPSSNYSASGVVYTAHVFGRNAYAISDVTDLGNPNSPKIYLVQGADKFDPLNQVYAMVGWKAFWGVHVVRPEWLVQVFTQTGYV